MDRYTAVNVLKERGNLVKIEELSNIKKFVYPDEAKLNSMIEEASARISSLEHKMSEWKAKLGEFKKENKAGIIAKLKDPLYRQHLKQYIRSSEYREQSRIVNPPFENIYDPSYRPMLRKFVIDPDYRLTMVQSKEGFFAQAEQKKEGNVEHEVITKRIRDLESEIKKEKQYIEACFTLIDWFKKSKKITFRKPVKGTY